MKRDDELAAGVALGVILLGMQPKRVSVLPPAVAKWRPLIEPLCAQRGIPVEFALRWIAMESGGNPCAIGDPRQAAANGQPAEIGLAQTYNPDDLAHLGVAAAELRACCRPGRGNSVLWRGHAVVGFSPEMVRPQTPAEAELAARVAVDTIAVKADEASLAMQAAGASWKERDYWALVKLQHNLPGMATKGLAAVARTLGRAPGGWQEFRAALLRPDVAIDQGTDAHRGQFAELLAVAERCAEVVK